MRGKRAEWNALDVLDRITPARAGKTGRTLYNLRIGMDHPRACGENYLEDNRVYLIKGSPPRVRGKLSP